jgi:hypothetical protein
MFRDTLTSSRTWAHCKLATHRLAFAERGQRRRRIHETENTSPETSFEPSVYNLGWAGF